MIEKMILEEFGRCLLSIIHTANGTKGKSDAPDVSSLVCTNSIPSLFPLESFRDVVSRSDLCCCNHAKR